MTLALSFCFISVQNLLQFLDNDIWLMRLNGAWMLLSPHGVVCLQLLRSEGSQAQMEARVSMEMSTVSGPRPRSWSQGNEEEREEKDKTEEKEGGRKSPDRERDCK